MAPDTTKSCQACRIRWGGSDRACDRYPDEPSNIDWRSKLENASAALPFLWLIPLHPLPCHTLSSLPIKRIVIKIVVLYLETQNNWKPNDHTRHCLFPSPHTFAVPNTHLFTLYISQHLFFFAWYSFLCWKSSSIPIKTMPIYYTRKLNIHPPNFVSACVDLILT